MKLNYKYTIAYAAITFVVLSIGFAIVYNSIQRNAVQSLSGKLERLNEVIAQQMKSGKDYTGHPSRRNVEITPVSSRNTSASESKVDVNKEWNEELQAEVKMLHLSTFKMINGQLYRISSKAVLIEPDDIYLNGIILVFAWTFVFLLALVVVLSEIISWYILKPFNDTLEAIQLFQINQENTIDVHDTQTYEFRELNAFLVKMTNKAKSDYIAIKEFSENASHELQTPIATMKAKIEMLMDTSLNEEQVNALSEIHNELERLARINSSLTLLAKLEHYEFNAGNSIDFSKALQECLTRFSDWMEMKDIQLQSEITPGAVIALDESLGQLLLTNLISNAIRHNILHGKLIVTLTASELTIQNTGEPPLIPVEQLFGRFKKGNSALDSIGIGLAIVKKICTLYQYDIQYAYAEGLHTVRVTFNSRKV
ncbi:MAG: HAMP domain-containing sensor histidine kinase [Taibaiella sp.]|jgi:signal transduction histidine kinase